MKTFNKIFMTLGLAAAVTGLPSCVGDLDLERSEERRVGKECM